MSIKYVGDRAIVGIPTTDLTDDEIAALAKRRNKKPADLRKELLDSGIYTEARKATS